MSILVNGRVGDDLNEELFESIDIFLTEESVVDTPKQRMEHAIDYYGRDVMDTFIAQKTIMITMSDASWVTPQQNFRNYKKKASDYAEECKEECDLYFSTQKKREFAKLINDSHYNPKDKNCLLNQTRPKDSIGQSSRYYASMLQSH
jgi:hypothetical protein